MLLFVIASKLHGDIIATEAFSYPSESMLNGKDGGQGWATPWTAVTSPPAAPVAVDLDGFKAIRFNDGSGSSNISINEVAYRLFDDNIEGNEFFVSVRMMFTGQQPGFFALWFDEANAVGQNGAHTSNRLNFGTVGGHWVARTHTADAPDYARIIQGPKAVPGEIVHLVVRYAKHDPGAIRPPFTLRFADVTLWINPEFDDFDHPIGTIEDRTDGLRSIGSMGVRMNGVPSGTKYFVGDLTIATRWEDLGLKPQTELHGTTEIEGRVSAENDGLSAAFEVVGPDPAHVVIRGLGPALNVLDALADPRISVIRLDGNHVVDEIDTWDPVLRPLFRFLDIPDLADDSLDAAMALELRPGNYEVKLRGASPADEGLARIEVHLDNSDIFRKDVFISGQGEYHTYRIPAMVVSTKGTILAFCEARRDGWADHGAIDIILRRSFDQGRTWGPIQLVWGESDEDGDPVTIGNPVPVVDRVTGNIHLVFVRNNGHATLHMVSTDDGETFSPPEDISYAITEMTRRAGFNWPGRAMHCGPGHGLQTRGGRLIVPVKPTGPVQNGAARRVGVIYSDDHGVTWEGGGLVPPTIGELSEANVIERSDGSLLINMRWHDGASRAISESFNGGLRWTRPVPVPELVDPISHGTIINHSYEISEDNYRVIFANLAHEPTGNFTQRRRLTARLSRDEGETWPGTWVVTPGPSGYSDLGVTQSGRMLLLYENGVDDYRESITFARFDRSVFVSNDPVTPQKIPTIQPLHTDELSVSWITSKGMTYELQGSSDLSNWQTLSQSLGDGQPVEIRIPWEQEFLPLFLRMHNWW